MPITRAQRRRDTQAALDDANLMQVAQRETRAQRRRRIEREQQLQELPQRRRRRPQHQSIRPNSSYIDEVCWLPQTEKIVIRFRPRTLKNGEVRTPYIYRYNAAGGDSVVYWHALLNAHNGANSVGVEFRNGMRQGYGPNNNEINQAGNWFCKINPDLWKQAVDDKQNLACN
tara:strand:+ start:2330 stop:2845 length:516 start_codon:yes stop_codon:yes gene_type:complete